MPLLITLQKSLLGFSSAALLLSSGIYWYVFVAGVPQLDPPPVEQNTGLTFHVETVTSVAMGEQRQYGIVLPQGYEQQQNRRYPVIFLLHGGHGTARDFQDKAALTSILHDLYQQKKLPPTIVITPDGNDRRGTSPFFDPDYFDGPNGKVATWIGTELVNHIKSHYRTLAQPQMWAVGGLSSGGWGAFNIGLRRVDQFHVLFSHTGYFIDKRGENNSPQQFIHQLPVSDHRKLRIYLDAGESDYTYLKATTQFHQTLAQLQISHEFQVFPGGHGIVGANSGWNYWHKHLMNSLGYVGRQFNQALSSSAQTP